MDGVTNAKAFGMIFLGAMLAAVIMSFLAPVVTQLTGTVTGALSK